jgi:hypothetical protein
VIRHIRGHSNSGGHISWHELFLAGNQGDHQNLVPSMLLHQFVIDLNKNEAKKVFIFLKKKIKMADYKKLSFSTTTKS